jgi:glycosyltransferase involved in cell wall biosynthesis
VTTDQVSVLMTVRDGARYLDHALGSVLGQTVAPAEVIVVDDGSTDATAAILRSYGPPVRVLRQPPTGTGAGFNRALGAARGHVFAFLDADDVWAPDALERRLARLHQPDRPDGVGGRTVQFVSPELDPASMPSYRFAAGPVRGAVVGSILLRREVHQVVGDMDEALAIVPTFDWVARIQGSPLRLAWIDEVVLHRRIHRNNVSVTARRAMALELVEVVRRHHQRHRSDGGKEPS